VEGPSVEVNLALIAWGALTSLLTVVGAIMGFLLKGWMRTMKDDVEKLKVKTNDMLAEEARCKINVATDFVRRKDCQEIRAAINETMTKVFDKIDKMCEKIDKQHAQVMYELGIRNGISKAEKDKNE
jgi:hypothetical protein